MKVDFQHLKPVAPMFKANSANAAKNQAYANITNPIKDLFVKSKPKELTKEELEIQKDVGVLKEMKKFNGSPRFTDKDLEVYSTYKAKGAVDMEAVNTLKDTTDFDMDSIVNAYLVKRENKKDIYKDIINVAQKLPVGQKANYFPYKQNRYSDEQEHGLYIGYKSEVPKELKQGVSNILFVRKPNTDLYYYDMRKKDFTSQVKTEYVKSDKENVTFEKTTYIDKTKKSNPIVTQYKSFDLGILGATPILEAQEIVRKDARGKVIRTEKMTQSDIRGVYNIEYVSPGGKKQQISSGTIDPKTGIKTVKKDMVSDNGTRTQYLYQDDPNGNRIVDYKITDKKGNILLNNSQSFEVVDDNHYISTVNGHKYEITANEKSLTVKDTLVDKELTISFPKKIKGIFGRKKMAELLKQVPGDELYDVVASTKSIEHSMIPLSSQFNYLNKKLNTNADLFVFLHELGHAKDRLKFGYNFGVKHFIETSSFLDKDFRYSYDEDIQKTYDEERERFVKNHSKEEQQIVNYFIDLRNEIMEERSRKEVVAETNALKNTPTGPKTGYALGDRTHYLQQYFPETIAKIATKMNRVNDISSIEFYGT